MKPCNLQGWRLQWSLKAFLLNQSLMISFLFFIPVIDCKERKINTDRTWYINKLNYVRMRFKVIRSLKACQGLMISFLFFIPVIDCNERKINRDRTRHLHEFLNFLFADILRETRDQKGRMTSTNVLHRRKKNTKNTKIQNSSRTAQRTATGAHWLSTANISRLSNAFFYDHWPKKAYVKHNRSSN